MQINPCANMSTIRQSSTIDLQDNTPFKCNEYCIQNNYTYAGILLGCCLTTFIRICYLGVGGKHGTTCVCGTGKDFCSMEKGSNCTVSCPTTAILCGGVSSYSVFGVGT